MNKIRKKWKNNGTPFFFRMRYDDIVCFIDSSSCLLLDCIPFDDGIHTCMDILVDIHYVIMKLQQISSSLIYDSVKYELYTIFQLVCKVAHLKSQLVDGVYHFSINN